VSRLRVAVLNGPNLAHLGRRQPDIYGPGTLDDLSRQIGEAAASLGMEVSLTQVDGEGEMVSAIWRCAETAEAIVINPGGYSHTSVAVLDALEAYPGRVVEVHISQVFRREEERRNLLTARAADAVIVGAGLDGYRLALEYLSRAGRASRGPASVGGSDDHHE